MNKIDVVQLSYLKGLEALRYWELKTVIAKFNKLRIPVMLLKGSIELAMPDNHPPGSPPYRMRDIDLLIHFSDWKRAGRGLEELGYHLDRKEIDNKDFPFIGQREFVRDVPQGRIDLHYDLNKCPSIIKMIDNEGMWERAIEFKFDRYRVFIPSVTDHIWYQIVHLFFFHTYSMEALFGDNGLVWHLISIADYNRERIDWGEIFSRSKSYGAEVPLNFLAYGMKSKYNEIYGLEIDEEKIRYVAKIWKWVIQALQKPKILTHALGRYTILSLIRRYNMIKIARIYFSEIGKGVMKEDLLAKYKLSRLSFLYPMVYIVHFLRLVLLHMLAGVLHTEFQLKERKAK